MGFRRTAWNRACAVSSPGFLSGGGKHVNTAPEEEWNVSLTGMSDDGELSVGLLDLKLGSCWRDAQGVIIGGISDHDGSRVRTLQRSIEGYQK